MKTSKVAVVAVAGALLGSSVWAQMGTIKEGSVVSLQYVLKADNQYVIPPQKKDFLQLVVGRGAYPPTFERALIGLKTGDRKSITLKPDQAYGPSRPELIKRVPRSAIPPGLKLVEGGLLSSRTGATRMRVAKILNDSVILDENHPLAGKTLTYEVLVTDLE